MAEVSQTARDAAANVVMSYRDRKNGDWQARIRKGECDDGVMVQAIHAAEQRGREESEKHRNDLMDKIVQLQIELGALTAMQASRDDEVERIVAWLRSLAGEFVTPPILAFFGDPFKRDGQLLCVEIADAIERGDHRTQGDGNECICPKCGKRHGGEGNEDGKF